MQQEKKEVMWAYLFLLFLGGFGAHKFYLGRPYMAVFYICTGAVLGMGLVYDMFTLPFQVAQANQQIDAAGSHHYSQEATSHRKCCCTCGQ